MTKPKRDNLLYTHLNNIISAALPLEYAIRAAKEASSREMEQLLEIDKRIRRYWIDLGASEAEIDAEFLMDFAWDTIQVGLPLTRGRHGRFYPNPQFAELIYCGLIKIPEEFSAEVSMLNMPATKFFRICDLLNGNDVLRLLKATAQCLADSADHEAGDSIALEKFVLGIRLPIHIHPGVRYVGSEQGLEQKVEFFGIELDTEMEFSLPDLKRQMRLFLYQFAVRRQALRQSHIVDRTSSELINEFLRDERLGRIDGLKAKRLDGLISPLTGLYCWDLVQQYRQLEGGPAVDKAIRSTLEIYPKKVRAVGEETIRKNYNTARGAISKCHLLQKL